MTPAAPSILLRHLMPVAFATTVLLTACGGGSDDNEEATDTDPAAKYVGIWSAPCESQATSSYIIALEMSKAGPHAVSGKTHQRVWNVPNCPGAEAAVTTVNFSMVIDGTGVASGKAVDKVSTSPKLDDTEKMLFAIEGNALYTTLRQANTYDADGYPQQINVGWVLTK